MTIQQYILQNVFSGKTGICSLCFNATEDVEGTQFHVTDEILMEDGSNVMMYEIISSVLGDQVSWRLIVFI